MEGFGRNRIPAEFLPNSSAADEFEKENLQLSPTWNIFELVLDNCCLPTIYFFVIKKHYRSVCVQLSPICHFCFLFPKLHVDKNAKTRTYIIETGICVFVNRKQPKHRANIKSEK